MNKVVEAGIEFLHLLSKTYHISQNFFAPNYVISNKSSLLMTDSP